MCICSITAVNQITEVGSGLLTEKGPLGHSWGFIFLFFLWTLSMCESPPFDDILFLFHKWQND